MNMKRTLLLLAALVAPVVLAIAMGIAGCDADDHHHRDGGRDRDRMERHDRDRH